MTLNNITSNHPYSNISTHMSIVEPIFAEYPKAAFKIQSALNILHIFNNIVITLHVSVCVTIWVLSSNAQLLQSIIGL